MPWKLSDAPSTANTDRRRRMWRDVANERRRALMADGVPEKQADARAKIAANQAVRADINRRKRT